MNSEWRQRLTVLAASVAFFCALVVSGTPAAAHEGHGGNVTTTTAVQSSGGLDIGGLLPYIGIGVVALAVGGIVLWREMS